MKETMTLVQWCDAMESVALKAPENEKQIAEWILVAHCIQCHIKQIRSTWDYLQILAFDCSKDDDALRTFEMGDAALNHLRAMSDMTNADFWRFLLDYQQRVKVLLAMLDNIIVYRSNPADAKPLSEGLTNSPVTFEVRERKRE